MILSRLVERVTRRMRDGGRAGRTVVLRLRFDDYFAGDPLDHADPSDRGDLGGADAGQEAATRRPAIDRT